MSDLFKLSVSKNSTFKSCKKKYHFTYILKLPQKQRDYHIFGRFVHQVLENFHQLYLDGTTESAKSNMSAAFNKATVDYRDKISLSMKNEAIEICQIYLSTIAYKMPNVLAVEKSFALKINDNLILNGMIDRVQLDDDGIYHVVDYKTSKSKSFLKNDVLQLLTYAYVIYQENPTIDKVRVSYIMLRHNCEPLVKEFSAKDILLVKEMYENFATEILNERKFAASPSVLCEYCDHIDICAEGKTFISSKFKTGQIKW